MSEVQPQERATSGPAQANHYRIRKELIWIFVAGLLGAVAYQINDYFSHLNWPPHDDSHPKEVLALGCPPGVFGLKNDAAPGMPRETSNQVVIDSSMFFRKPECAAFTYLKFEGSGMRLTHYVYDVQKKRRTATIETTFEKIEEN